MQKIKKGDEVIVIAGRSKGQRGSVLKRVGEDRLLVENVNMVKKHTKARQDQNGGMIEGGIIEKEAPLSVSNVAINNPESGKADRIGYKIQDDGSKVRVYKSSGDLIDA